MRVTWMPLVGACGLFEGVENPARYTCEVLTELELEDTHQDPGFLEPLGARLDAVTGAFPISATQLEPAGDESYPGTLTLALSGPIVAVEQRPEYGGPGCENGYEVPVDATLDLDGGLLHVALPMTLVVQDADPAVYSWGTMEKLRAADFETALDLRFPFVTDAGVFYVDPHSVHLDVEFLDGSTPSATIVFEGEVDTDEELFDGSDVVWTWMILAGG